MKRTVLVTGGTGYVGSRLVTALVHEGYRVFLLTRNASDLTGIKGHGKNIEQVTMASLERTLKKNTVNGMIHCATNYGRNGEHARELVEVNLLLPVRLLELARAYSVPLFLNTDTVLNRDTSAYALSKKQFREWLERSSDTLIAVNMEIDQIYGPCDAGSKFITSITRKLLHNDGEIALTKGDQKRFVIYIDDVISAYMHVLKKAFSFAPGFYNIPVGGKRPVRIKDLVLTLKKLTNNRSTRLLFGALPYRKGENRHTKIRTSVLKAMGWKERTGLVEGLKRTVQYEKRNIP